MNEYKNAIGFNFVSGNVLIRIYVKREAFVKAVGDREFVGYGLALTKDKLELVCAKNWGTGQDEGKPKQDTVSMELHMDDLYVLDVLFDTDTEANAVELTKYSKYIEREYIPGDYVLLEHKFDSPAEIFECAKEYNEKSLAEYMLFRTQDGRELMTFDLDHYDYYEWDDKLELWNSQQHWMP